MLSVNLCLLFGSFGGTARRHLNLRQYCGLQKTGTPCRAASLRCCYSFYYIICFACVNGYFDEYYAGISSLLFTPFLCRFSFPSFFTSSRHSRSPTFILTYYPKVYLKSKTPDISISQLHPNKKAAASNLPAAAYLIIIALPDVPLRFISITLRCHPGYLPQKHPSSFRCATYLFHLFPWRQPSAVVPGRSLWCRSGSVRVLQ